MISLVGLLLVGKTMINIDELIIRARKAKNSIEVKAYQNIKVEIQKNQTAKGAKPLTEELQIQIIGKYAKSLEDAIKQFSEAHRDDLVSEYSNELEVVQSLLPAPVDPSEIDFHLYNWADELNYYSGEILEDRMGIAIPKQEMGAAIRFLKSKFPTADGKMISEIVKKYLV